MRALNIILCLLIIVSCKSKMELVSSEKTDSIRVTEKYVEQTIIVPGDSLKTSFPLIIENNKPVAQKVEVKGDRGSMKVEVTETGTVNAESICDEYETKVKVLEKTIESYKNEVNTYQEQESWFRQKIGQLKDYIFWIVVVFGILVLIKYAKPFLSLIKSLLK